MLIVIGIYSLYPIILEHLLNLCLQYHNVLIVYQIDYSQLNITFKCNPTIQWTLFWVVIDEITNFWNFSNGCCMCCVNIIALNYFVIGLEVS